MRRRLVRLTAVLLVVVLVAQGVGASAVTPQVEPESNSGAADEVYVGSDGDVVAVYETPASGNAANRTEYGVSTAANLAYLRVTDPVSGTPAVRGALSMTATRTSLEGQGNLSMPKPPAIEAFDFALSTDTTAETSQSDLTLSTTVEDTSTMSRLVRSATTNGTVTVTADRLTASGDLDVQTSLALPDRLHQSLDVSFREEGNGYVLSVDQSRSVPAYRNVPRDRAALEQSLRQRYALVAQSLGGTASVEVQQFSATDGERSTRVEQAYTVRFTGIDQGLQRVVRQQLAANPQVSSEQADRFATALAEVRINEVRVKYDVTRTGLTGSVDVDVRNYGNLAMAYLDVAGSIQPGSTDDGQLERFRSNFEAMRSSNLEQTVTWSGGLSFPDQNSVHGEFEMHASATNWAAYADELRNRGIPVLERHVSFQGGIQGDRLVFTGDASLSGERLYQELLRGFPASNQMSPEAASMVSAVRESRPKKAKLVATYDSDGVLIEAGASFGNLSALVDGMQRAGSIPPVTEIVGRADADGGETYLRIDGAVEEQPSKSSVRSLSYVDETTTIHMPGDWNREFPSMNVDRAREFLGITGESVGTSGSGPGFGATAAVVALVAALGLLARRDR